MEQTAKKRTRIEEEEAVWASVEIKSVQVHKTIANAQRIANKHGTYFKCNVGDKLWAEVVYKPTYRAQILMQAFVMGVTNMLFVVGSNHEKIIYCVLVSVTAEQLKRFAAGLNIFTSLLEWPFMEGGKPPNTVSDDAKKITLSHFPLWSAMRKFVTSNHNRPPPPSSNCEVCDTNYIFHVKTRG